MTPCPERLLYLAGNPASGCLLVIWRFGYRIGELVSQVSVDQQPLPHVAKNQIIHVAAPTHALVKNQWRFLGLEFSVGSFIVVSSNGGC